MTLRTHKKILLLVLLLIAGISFYFLSSSPRKVDFSADVKPILNKKCISCHGGVKKQGGFSVLFREDALAVTKSGRPAIIPGDPENSEMIKRLNNKDPEERMPYRHPPLSKKEIATLTQWVKQGAKWGNHWAYLPVAAVEVPTVSDKWIRNDVDKFILDKLDEKELKPSAEANKATLLRRVSLDLTGTYPTDAVAQKYLQSTTEEAYETLVDTLLASPRYGERWASMWLDLARYADTKGYESDGGRNIWEYRDWVIRAFNKDMPYNTFITEQLAGDLLPNPSNDQYIATAFSRNSMTNDEGGTDNEEFRIAAVMDRVNSTWEGLMSTTFSCVQCHSHPYDPFRHDEYYKFMAYFNNTRDEDVPGEYPLLRKYPDSLQSGISQVNDWLQRYGNMEEAKKLNLFLRTWQPAINSTTADSLVNAVIINHNVSLSVGNHSSARLKNVDLNDAGQLIISLYSKLPKGILSFHMDTPEGPLLATMKLDAQTEWRKQTVAIAKQAGVHDVYLRYDNPSQPMSTNNFSVIFDWFAFLPAIPGIDQPGFADIDQLFWQLATKNVATVPIMIENTANRWRKTNVFQRGNRRTLGEEVKPAVPASLAYAMPKNAPANRLGLAEWLTDIKNPLVSRTIVNRLWEQLFGTGIAETLEDMGTQGLPPTHQQLLDHLAWKLMNDDQWSIKKLIKELVMSATYRQDSKVTDELKEKDMFNRYYARGPRIRLSAEQIRDQHLYISGLLSAKMYGPGVMPWQPAGIWSSPYNGARWISSKNENQYRRAIYTYWKRSSPYPSMINFDAAQRVVCNARRIRTNTPLQALVMLNDSAYLDMARHFAQRMKTKAGDTVKDQVGAGYAMMLYKPITAERMQVFLDLYKKAETEFKKEGEEAICEMLGNTDKESHTAAAAAMVVVANAMLNIDEIVMKN